jgi:hypothetical protein
MLVMMSLVSTKVTSFICPLAASTACALLILHNKCSCNTLLVTFMVEALTSTGATLCCSSFCVSCCLLMRMEVAVLKRFLD